MRWLLPCLLIACALPAPADVAGDALREAAEALEANDFAAAIPHLEAALAADAENSNARFNLAYAYLQTGDEPSAIEQYGALVEAQPAAAQARRSLAMLLMRNERPAEAVEHWAALAAANPEDFSLRLAWADALDKAGDPAGAVEPYEQAVALDETSVDALLGLGYALARQRRFSEAAAYYLRAAKIDPAVESMTLQLANEMEQRGQQTDALELYRRYARNHPGEAAVQERVGMILLERGRFGQAVEALEKAVAADSSAANRAALAQAYAHAGDAERGVRQLREAVNADPESAALRVRYANGLLALRQFEQAAQQYLAAVERKPDTIDGWNGLAFTMFQLENYPAALKALEQSEKLGARKPASLYLKALAQDKLQLYAEARSSYQKFLAMSPDMEDEVWKAGERVKVIDKVLAKR